MPAWDKGIQPIARDHYWNAVECGKQGGDRPACVFYDADFCKNDEFVIALFTLCLRRGSCACLRVGPAGSREADNERLR